MFLVYMTHRNNGQGMEEQIKKVEAFCEESEKHKAENPKNTK